MATEESLAIRRTQAETRLAEIMSDIKAIEERIETKIAGLLEASPAKGK